MSDFTYRVQIIIKVVSKVLFIHHIPSTKQGNFINLNLIHSCECSDTMKRRYAMLLPCLNFKCLKLKLRILNLNLKHGENINYVRDNMIQNIYSLYMERSVSGKSVLKCHAFSACI